MTRHRPYTAVLLGTLLLLSGIGPTTHQGNSPVTLDYQTSVDPILQSKLESIDQNIRLKLDITPEQASCGVIDLTSGKIALIHPDRIDYAASVAKIGILLAYFDTHPTAAKTLNPTTRHELGLMAKASSNEMAAKYSEELGLKNIQTILDKYGFYDPTKGGGIWVGKHYGKSTERYLDPIGHNSHAITVRQVLRYFLLLEQDQLISPEASATMRDIFRSPEIPHDDIKFVKALASRGLKIYRKWGSWENWLHDSAVIEGPNRKYILVGMTQHPKGDEYLEALAREVDDLLSEKK